MQLESIQLAIFAVIAVVGFRSNLWLVVGGLAAHGVFDLAHDHVIANPGVPAWWPAFCSAADVVLALLMGVLLYRGTVPARPAPLTH